MLRLAKQGIMLSLSKRGIVLSLSKRAVMLSLSKHGREMTSFDPAGNRACPPCIR